MISGHLLDKYFTSEIEKSDDDNDDKRKECISKLA